MGKPKPRNTTDYSRGIYGVQLPLSSASATRQFLKVSDLACAKWGSPECASCPLQHWAAEPTPW
jgi:hypothetical protein